MSVLINSPFGSATGLAELNEALEAGYSSKGVGIGSGT
jgi:hypothetical protein